MEEAASKRGKWTLGVKAERGKGSRGAKRDEGNVWVMESGVSGQSRRRRGGIEE